MGLTIHYSGKLKSASSLSDLIDEVIDVAISNQWDYFVFEDKFPNNSFSQEIDKKNLYGVMVSPPGSEPVNFSFLNTGKMCGILNYNHLQIDPSIKGITLYTNSTKTQFSSPEIHQKIVLLLDYINTKYLKNFECYDEGKFWETRNTETLIEVFERNEKLINSFSSAIEMIPKKEGENLEDYLIRLADITKKKNMNENENPDNEFPKLNLEDEISFKKLKLRIESNAFFNEEESDIPTEIEKQFLDNIIEFEKQFEKTKQTTVYEKIGKPNFKPLTEIKNKKELKKSLDEILNIMSKNDIFLDILCDYENKETLIYDFIINELFNHEMNDISIPGMISHFIYEEFHPNHRYDLEHQTIDFIKMFLKKEDDFYEKFHEKDTDNHVEINTFRSLFQQFETISFEIISIDFNEEEAKAAFKIEFYAFEEKNKLLFSGMGSILYAFQYGFWYPKIVNLPIK